MPIDKSQDALDLLRMRYLSHITAAAAANLPVTSYPCPDCDERIGAIVPAHKEQCQDFDEAQVICPHCGDIHYRLLWSSGEIAINGVDL